MANLQKKQFVADLSSRLTDKPRIAVVDFSGLTHLAFEDLRKRLKEKDATIEVLKNSLFTVALKKINKRETADGEVLKGPSAVIFLPEDYISVLSEFYKFAKDYETVSFKMGIIDDEVYLQDKLNQLAKLPSRSELVVKIITSLRNPATRVVYAFNYAPTKIVQVLNAAAQSKN